MKARRPDDRRAHVRACTTPSSPRSRRPCAWRPSRGPASRKPTPCSTGVTAVKLGAVAFIIPFIFVFEPALLMQGSTTEIVTAFASALIGVIGIASGMQLAPRPLPPLGTCTLARQRAHADLPRPHHGYHRPFRPPYSLVRTAPQKGRFPRRGRLTVPE